MKKIYKEPDGSTTVILHLNANERQQLKQLGRQMDLNDFETLKYCLQLVSWWSRGKIEQEEK